MSLCPEYISYGQLFWTESWKSVCWDSVETPNVFLLIRIFWERHLNLGFLKLGLIVQSQANISSDLAKAKHHWGVWASKFWGQALSWKSQQYYFQ